MTRDTMQAVDAPETVAHLVSLLRGFDAATLVTRSRAGALQGRPTSVARVEDNATIWLVTSAGAIKADELSDDGRAIVTLQAGSRFVSVNGRAELVSPEAALAALGEESYRVWYDGQAEPELGLVHFTAFEAEYWDDSADSGFWHAVRAAKAYVTGHPPRSQDTLASEPEAYAKLRLWTPEPL